VKAKAMGSARKAKQTAPWVHRFDEALPRGLFTRLRRKVLALGSERLRTTYQTTFWYPFSGPTNVAEYAVEALRPVVPQTGIAGVEWWLARMNTNDVQVDFHKDRDEKLALRREAVRHPRISSVFFLNTLRRGGTLVVTDELPVEANPALAPEGRNWELVKPKGNRFVWFDGTLTHGVLDANNEIPAAKLKGEGEWRYALIVNWWDRRPTDIPTFTESRAYRSLRDE
jgi:hypothetical protein